jgi:signal transduction histidine kinase
MRHIDDLAGQMRAEEDRLFVERTTKCRPQSDAGASMTGIGSGLVVVLAGISIFLVRRSARARDDAEALLRDNNLNLEATVDERTADLREANDEIQRFAYIVSHDLRSPLVNIMGFTSELEELRGDIFKRIATLGRASSASAGAGQCDRDAEPVLEGPTSSSRRISPRRSEFIKSSIAKMDRLIIGDPQPHPRGPARIRAGADRHPRTDRRHRLRPWRIRPRRRRLRSGSSRCRTSSAIALRWSRSSPI